MGNNKIIIGDEVLIDTTTNTASPDDVMISKTFTDSAGDQRTGTFSLDEEMTEQDSLISQIKNALKGKASPEVGGSVTVTVDENGDIFVSGNGSGSSSIIDELELINSGEIPADAAGVYGFEINKDKDGSPFSLKRAIWKAHYERTGGLAFHASTPSINGYSKSSFFKNSANQGNNTDFYLIPFISPPSSFKPYGNSSTTITADMENYPFIIDQDYEFYLDEYGKLRIKSFTSLYEYDSAGVCYPVFSNSGSCYTFQENCYHQRERENGTGNVIEFPNGIESIKWDFNYATGKGFKWELWGERM